MRTIDTILAACMFCSCQLLHAQARPQVKEEPQAKTQSQNPIASCMASAVSGNVLEQFNSIDPNDTAEFMVAWQKGLRIPLGGKDADALYLMMLPAKIPELFQNGEFDAARGKAMGGRLGQITPEILQVARAALSRIDPKADDLSTAVLLARHEPLYKGETLITGKSNQFAERLGRIPQPAITRWATASGLDRALAATSIARCDGLLGPDGSFNESRFDGAYAAAETLAKDRRK